MSYIRRQKRKIEKSKVSKETQIKILKRMNSSYEIFRTFEIERLTEIIRSGVCISSENEDFETFKLSNTDKMALHKAIKEKVYNKSLEEQLKKEGEKL